MLWILILFTVFSRNLIETIPFSVNKLVLLE